MVESLFSQNGSAQVNEAGTDLSVSKPVRVIPREFLPELQSAASMVMSREECAELERELQELLHSRPAAA